MFEPWLPYLVAGLAIALVAWSILRSAARARIRRHQATSTTPLVGAGLVITICLMIAGDPSSWTDDNDSSDGDSSDGGGDGGGGGD
jgi:uncharacterized membrane protein YgcG